MLRIRLLSLILCTILFHAPGFGAPSSSATLKPEEGYLSATRYLNRYFGLSFAIPKELDLLPVPVDHVQGTTRWLLGLRNIEETPPVTVIITAEPQTKKDPVSVLRSEFTELPAKPKPVTIGGQNFWKAASSRKEDAPLKQTVAYAGVVRDYLIKIILTAQGVVPESLITAVEGASFVAPEAVAAARTSDMVEYAGPALPELGKPTDAIATLAPGSTDARRYRNDTLGIDFAIPPGLNAHPLNTAFESAQEQMLGSDGANAMEHKIDHTCSRTLLVADDGTQPKNGHVSPTVMLTVLDRLCVGGVRFPRSVSDTREIKLVAAILADRIRSVHAGTEMKGRVYSLRGHIMLNLSGSLYGTEPGTGLRIPNRVRLIATELNGYWVLWAFLAPDKANLDRITNTSVSFYPQREAGRQVEPANE